MTRQPLKPDDAKPFTRPRGWPIALVIVIDPDSGDVSGASWGTNFADRKNWQPICKLSGRYLNAALKGLEVME